MTVSVNWATDFVIHVQVSDLTFFGVDPISGRDIYTYDTRELKDDLKDLEASEDGAPYTDTHSHDIPKTLSGVVYAPKLEIIAPYFVEFDDDIESDYAVLLDGTNNNLLDRAVVNSVSIRPNNSAGLIARGTFTSDDVAIIVAGIFGNVLEGTETFEQLLALLRAAAAGTIVEQPDGSYVIKSADGAKDRITGDDAANGGRTISATDGT